MANLQVGVAGNGTVTVGAGASVHSPASNTLTLGTNNSEKFRINSSGHLSLGGSNVTDVNLLTLNGSGASQNIGIVFNKTNSTAKAHGIQVNNSTGDLIFYDYTASAERLRIKSDGGFTFQQGNSNYPTDFIGGSTNGRNYVRVQAGNTTSGHNSGVKLNHSDGNGVISMFINHDDDHGHIMNEHQGGDILFYTNASGSSLERLRIDSSGRLLLGHTATIDTSTFNSNLQVMGTDAHGSSATFGRFSNDASSSSIHLSKSRNGTKGSHTIVNDNDSCGNIFWWASDGSDYEQVAQIGAEIDGTPGSGDTPGALTFSTTADGASTSTERFRITSGGKFHFGNATNNAGSNGRMYVMSGTGQCTADFHHSTNDNQNVLNVIHGGVGVSGNPTRVMIEWRDFNNSSVAQVSSNSSTVTYGTGSDYRMKENQVDISDGITRVKQLKPYRFNWKSEYGGGDKVDGFFAHEAATVVPEAVKGTKDAVDSNGDIIRQQIDQAKLVPVLTAALKEAIAKIEVLETKVAALESA